MGDPLAPKQLDSGSDRRYRFAYGPMPRGTGGMPVHGTWIGRVAGTTPDLWRTSYHPGSPAYGSAAPEACVEESVQLVQLGNVSH